MRWETEQLFDGQLCHEYSYQKLLKLAILLQVTIINVNDVFYDAVYIIKTQCNTSYQLFPCSMHCEHSYNPMHHRTVIVTNVTVGNLKFSQQKSTIQTITDE